MKRDRETELRETDKQRDRDTKRRQTEKQNDERQVKKIKRDR